LGQWITINSKSSEPSIDSEDAERTAYGYHENLVILSDKVKHPYFEIALMHVLNNLRGPQTLKKTDDSLIWTCLLNSIFRDTNVGSRHRLRSNVWNAKFI
jgi:hypothetical protein